MLLGSQRNVAIRVEPTRLNTGNDMVSYPKTPEHSAPDLSYKLAAFRAALSLANIPAHLKTWIDEACADPRMGLVDLFIVPHLLVPGRHYLYAPQNLTKPGGRGYSPAVTEKLLGRGSVLEALPRMQWISNPLAWTDPTNPTPPSERVKNVGLCLYTFEFDDAEHSGVDLMVRAHGWYTSGRLGRFHKALSRFRDYRGYSLVYSGRTSPHLHLLFDLRHLRPDLAGAGNSTYADHFVVEVPDDRLFAYHKIAWDKLQAEFAKHVDVTVRADRRMRSWTQPRRSPWGVRAVEVDKPHPWALLPGTEVPQVVLTEKFRSRARGATGWLHDPIEMLSVSTPDERSPTPRGNVDRRGNLDPTIARICERLINGPWPRFAYLEVVGGVNRFRFYNHSSDTSPDSYMAGARDRIDLVGTHDLGPGLVLSASADRITQAAAIAVSRQLENEHPIVEEWRATARGQDNMRSTLGKLVPQAVTAASRVWIRSVEGAGKTTALLNPSAMDLIHTFPVAPSEALDGVKPWPVRVMVACGSYVQAREKLEAFDRLCAEAGAPYKGFLFRSVTRLYRDCLDGEDEIKLTDAFKLGDGSIWRLVRTRQKAVWDRMLAARRMLHDMIVEGLIPVLFTVLDVAEGHADRRITRLFYAPSFDEGWYAADIDTRSALRLIYEAETPIETLIVDEVSVRSLVDIHPQERVELADAATAYIEKNSDLRRPMMYRAFQAWKEMQGGADMAFTEWEKLSALAYRDEHRTMVDVSIETPFDGSGHIYTAMNGRGVYIQPKTWWKGFPRVVFLTTENLPTVVAKAVVEDLVVFDFDTEVESNEVTLRLDRDANKEGLASLTARILAEAPDAAIISNMVEGATTHVSARGANGLADADIFGIYAAISPQQFSDLAALNVRFGLTDAVRLHYVDQFNQTAGRNRGMRNQGRTHVAVFSPRLYRWLAAHLAAFGRYRLRFDDVPLVNSEGAVAALTV